GSYKNSGLTLYSVNANGTEEKPLVNTQTYLNWMISPDSKYIITTGDNYYTRVFDINTGEQLYTVDNGGDYPLFSADG
ncbi:MAG TPA: hypothetical protein PKK43_11175, partial [Spirochaetota bacterium]|nr:hypothetical protein [Spirochaetota bacterium]